MKDIAFTAGHDGGLLACVRTALPDSPSGRVKSWLEHRLISVDGVFTSRFDFPVRAGQEIKIHLSTRGSSDCPLKILYEDEAVLAVEKPAGLLSVASDSEKERTAYRIIKESCGSPVFVVHRLDRDTSGVLLFAKTAEARDALQSSWNEAVVREYTALCEGVFTEKSGHIESLLSENAVHKVYSSANGLRAVTDYRVLSENQMYSLVRVNITTGRKNQIRVHLSELGNPVAGDKKYGAKTNPLRRLALHANMLTVTHPVTGKTLCIKSPVPKCFRLPD